MSGVDDDGHARANGHGEAGRQDRFDGQFPALLDAVRNGEPSGFDRMFRSLAPVVAAYLAAQGSAEPDDLTSEVFVGILRNIRRFDGDEAGFRSWVFTIAHRRLTDERRRNGRRPTFEPLTVATDLAAPDDVEDAVDRSLSTERVQQLCDRLNPDQRNVVLLRLVAHLSISEVATVLGMTPGAVRGLQRRGLAAICRIMERERARR